jgi:tetratricopeptide (TPR) repeat protein
VLGGSFPRQTVGALSEIDPTLLDELLSSLVRKEVLTVRADRLSPERGQYAFTQSLIRSVAYDMLTRAERKARHLRTAEHLRSAFPDEGAEVAEVIGAHLYDAYKAAGDDPDADKLRAEACAAYTRAGERAESVGAPEAAESAYLKAAELSLDEAEQASYTEQAGRMAREAGWNERALAHLEAAVSAHAKARRIIEVARVTGSVSMALDALGRGELAVIRVREALASLQGTDPAPEVLADLQVRLAGSLLFSGHADETSGPIEAALTLAEHHVLPETLARGFNAKAMSLAHIGRPVEARLLFEGMASVARESGLTRPEMTAENNLADLCMTLDLPGAEEHAGAALVLARRAGRREDEAWAAANLMYIFMLMGRLDRAFQLGAELLQGGDDRPGAAAIHYPLACLEAMRGNVLAARDHAAVCSVWSGLDDIQNRSVYASPVGVIALAAGDSPRALESARTAIEEATHGGMGIANETVRTAFPVALEAAVNLGELDEADRLAAILATRPRGQVPPFLRAQVVRWRALIAAARGDNAAVEKDLAAAEAMFRELAYPYWTARAQLDRAEWLSRNDSPENAARVAAQAASTFEGIGAAPMLVRARALVEPLAPGSSGVQLQASR